MLCRKESEVTPMADFLAAPSDWLGAQVGEMRLAREIWECNELVLPN